MPFFQPPVTPLPNDLDLSGHTAIVTGATSGLGYASARLLLLHKASTVIIAVRSTSKGEQARTTLLADPDVRKSNPTAQVKVLELDLADNTSVISFSNHVKQELTELHLLLLNAGVNVFRYTKSRSGYEMNTQASYLSNALLTFELFPLLEATALKTGQPSRLSWSRKEATPGVGVLQHFDDPDKFSIQRNGDTKALCVMFLEKLSENVDSHKVIVNSMCPGMVDTSLDHALPVYLRVIVNLVKKIRARTPEEGGWILVNALAVAGKESHGKFLGDKNIMFISKFIASDAGRELQQRLWVETLEEAKRMDSTAALGTIG